MVNLVIFLQVMMMMMMIVIMNHNITKKTKETLHFGSLVKIMSLVGIALGGKGDLVGTLNAQQLLILILVLILIFIAAALISGSLIILMR